MKTPSWDDRIARAEFLGASHPAAAEILSFYGKLAAFQSRVYDGVKSSSAADPGSVAQYAPELLKLVAAEGSEELRVVAAAERNRDWSQLLIDFWGHSSAEADEHTEFFLWVLMQPFAECISSRIEHVLDTATDSCPVCGSEPHLGVLRPEGEGAKRWLMCSLCAAEWQYRRVVCPHCGQEDKEKLPVFKSEKFPHIQIAACEVCNTYLKCIDLSIDGHAVPQVDDLASLPMSLWAQRQGYAPMHPNIFGF